MPATALLLTEQENWSCDSCTHGGADNHEHRQRLIYLSKEPETVTVAPIAGSGPEYSQPQMHRWKDGVRQAKTSTKLAAT